MTSDKTTILTSRVSELFLTKLNEFGGNMLLLWHHIVEEFSDETDNEFELGNRLIHLFEIRMTNHEKFSDFIVKFEVDCDVAGISKTNRLGFLMSLSTTNIFKIQVLTGL